MTLEKDLSLKPCITSLILDKKETIKKNVLYIDISNLYLNKFTYIDNFNEKYFIEKKGNVTIHTAFRQNYYYKTANTVDILATSRFVTFCRSFTHFYF